MSEFPHNSRTTRVEGASFPISFFSAVKDGVAELVEGHEFSSSSSVSSDSSLTSVSSQSSFSWSSSSISGMSSESSSLSSSSLSSISSSSDSSASVLVDESGMVAEANLNGTWYGVFYYPAGKSVFSAEKIQRVVAVFTSRPIVLSSDVTSWKDVSWVSSLPSGSRMYVYIRTADTEEGLNSAEWSRPLLNGSGEDISSLSGRSLQFKLAMVTGRDAITGLISTPEVESFSASCYVRGEAQAFYTKAVSLGFVPTHILLTYNGTVPADTLVTFAVSTVDSVNSKDFKTINPNSVEGVEEIANSSFLKICVSAVGNTEVPFVIDEFAVAVGGDGFTRTSES